MPAPKHQPTRVAFVGDLHGRRSAFEHTLATAVNRGVTTIIQTGDFWLGYTDPLEFAKMERIAGRVFKDAGLDVALLDYRFIDGNHENFTVLDPDADAPVAVAPWLTYMPRGSSDTILGVDFTFLGGASSIDKQWRVEGESWWPEENIREDQAARARPADVLVTHETGTSQFTELLAVNPHSRDKLYDPEGESNRELIDAVLDRVSPAIHVHGHHHAPRVTEGPRKTVSLSLETSVGSVVILDTEDMGMCLPWGRRDLGEDDAI